MKRKTRLPPWTPFVEGTLPEIDAAKVAKDLQVPVSIVRRVREETDQVFVNSRYQVNVRYKMPFANVGGTKVTVTYLSIKRRDKYSIHDWRDLQRIKNELVGEENEGFELYPAESRKVDLANQYHMWVFDDPTFRLPVGFQTRAVGSESRGNAKQRPYEEAEGVRCDEEAGCG